MSDIGLIAEIFLELLKLLKKNKPDEFKKEWVKDEEKFIIAWRSGDVATINALFDKYYRMLDILSFN
jgi:hypothetical protein